MLSKVVNPALIINIASSMDKTLLISIRLTVPSLALMPMSPQLSTQPETDGAFLAGVMLSNPLGSQCSVSRLNQDNATICELYKYCYHY